MLARLHSGGSLRQVQLAEPALGDPPNVSRLVDGLVAAGLVERAADPTDRRSLSLSVRPEGQRLAERITSAAVAERSAVFAGFTARELDQLAGLLDRLDDNVRALLAAPGH